MMIWFSLNVLFAGMAVVAAVGMYYDKERQPLREILLFTVPFVIASVLGALFWALLPVLGGGNWEQFIIVVGIGFYFLGIRNFGKYHGPYIKRRLDRRIAELRATIEKYKRG